MAISPAIMFSVFAAMLSMAGLTFVVFFAELARKYADRLAILAGGVLITIVIIHLAPTALSYGESGPMLMLGGFLGGVVLERLLGGTKPHGAPLTNTTKITLPLAAIAFHSFLDGSLYVVSFADSYHTGLLTMMGLILHEIPEAIVVFIICLQSRRTAKHAFWLTFVIAVATTPLGAIMTTGLGALIGEDVLRMFFPVSAGLLLYVAVGPLFSHLQRESNRTALPALTAGVVLAALAIFMHEFTGDDGHDHGPAEVETHPH